jgi:hypothetical protein
MWFQWLAKQARDSTRALKCSRTVVCRESSKQKANCGQGECGDWPAGQVRPVKSSLTIGLDVGTAPCKWVDQLVKLLRSDSSANWVKPTKPVEKQERKREKEREKTVRQCELRQITVTWIQNLQLNITPKTGQETTTVQKRLKNWWLISVDYEKVKFYKWSELELNTIWLNKSDCEV